MDKINAYPSIFDTALSELEKQARILKHIVAYLRSPHGCPWDKKQTLQSLTEYVLEESYETIEAIENKDFTHIQEELGDMLSQIFMIAQIAEELGKFSITDVFNGINTKLFVRHPHVFNDEKAADSDEALMKWNEMKLKEKKDRTSILDGIPKNLPSLLYALKAIRKSRLKNDSIDNDFILSHYLAKPINEENIGNLLLSIVVFCEKNSINPETMLKQATETFIQTQKTKDCKK